MAYIDELIAQIPDPQLRKAVAAEVAKLKERSSFGIVFERHIPEIGILPGLKPRPGSQVVLRDDPQAKALVVEAMKGPTASVRPRAGGATQTVKADELLVTATLGQPIYPALTSVGFVRRSEERPYHAVINGENYHALQLMQYLFAGQVDCIYIDPPYNTGARDWKYNNNYVDSNDDWRHSKWLSFMDKRLRLAKDLLKRDGVLIVTVDEHELHHLVMVVEDVFRSPAYLRYVVTIVNNPKGTFKSNFGRVDEQAIFVVPNIGYDVINPRPAGVDGFGSDDNPDDEHMSALIQLLVGMSGRRITDLLGDGSPVDEPLKPLLGKAFADEVIEGEQLEAELEPMDPRETNGAGLLRGQPQEYEDLFLRRRGQESSHRESRPNQFYALLVDEAKRTVVGVGPQLARDDPYEVTKTGDVLTVYPINADGEERVWRYNRETMQSYIDTGAIVVGRHNPNLPQPYTLNHRRPRKDVRRLKTVWWDKAHDAGTHGTNVVNAFLGQRNLFPFPKSIYAVKDCLAAVVRNRPDALILDFFAGSGTTFHATCLLNAEDGGRRRSVLVTNNEVSDQFAADLHRRNLWRGDAEFEKHGIFEAVTKPRCAAVVTGKRPDGKDVVGRYRTGRRFADGFDENVEFFRLDYLDKDTVELGRAFEAVNPCLWLMSGSIGSRRVSPGTKGWALAEGGAYALLFDEARYRAFKLALAGTAVQRVFLVTDSEEAYAEMVDGLGGQWITSMLYRDYLRNFQINVGQTQ
jgi:adenine-specific DNA-methyltransferase